MQVTSFAHLLEARKRVSATSFGSLELSSPADGLSTFMFLGTEDEIIGLIRRMADAYGLDVSVKDPGPCCCEYGDYFDRMGILTPIHNCPADAPVMWDSTGDVVLPEDWK